VCASFVSDDGDASVDLLWIPMGAGQSVVRLSGRVFEMAAALAGRRRRGDLFHSALEVRLDGHRFVIEMTPVPDGHGEVRGVVVEGAVGLAWLGRFRVFRYEVRCWRDGAIPDAQFANVSVLRLTDDREVVRRVLGLLPGVPNAVWGRDELHAGEMWNSNSVISWVLGRAGVDLAELHPPGRGRAPGWNAGIAVAARAREQNTRG
jgi:hypothetical protein